METKKRKKNWIPVVTAIIRKEDQVLIGLRPDGKNLAGQWEFPGGKLEDNETPEEALKRELQEELNIDAEIGDIKLAGTHSYGETGILLLFFEVRYWQGEPKAIHHESLQWIHPEKIKTLDIPEANRKLLDKILSFL